MALVFFIASIYYIGIEATLSPVFLGLAFIWIGETPTGYTLMGIGALAIVVKFIVKKLIARNEEVKRQLEIQENQENINFWRKYFHSDGFALDENKIPNHQDWMRFRTYWYVLKNLTPDNANQKAQQEYDKMWEDCRQYSRNKELLKYWKTFSNQRPAYIDNSEYKRMAELNIEGRASAYERQGYSFSESRTKARSDYYEDRMGDQ